MVIYLDGASFSAIEQYRNQVAGFTCNPTLMMQSLALRYEEFAKKALEYSEGKPFSFEVLADDSQGIYEQAHKISSWGENVFVKVPVMMTNGLDTYNIIRELAKDGIKLNVTAVFTLQQIRAVARSLTDTPAIISIFAGRIADTGRDPTPLFTEATRVKEANTQILWASPREVYNYYQAEQVGADIITMPPDLIKKLALKGKDLTQYSRETVQQFYEDGKGLTL